MSRSNPTYSKLSPADSVANVLDLRDANGHLKISQLPFTIEDVTAGTENEYQASVRGSAESVDLPQTILNSRYLANVERRAALGEAPQQAARDLRKYLDSNADDVWENSWVRFPARCLSLQAMEMLRRDLQSNRKLLGSRPRADVDQFCFTIGGEPWIRVPVSYVIKLSLSDVIGRQFGLPMSLRMLGDELLEQFSNDNTSPEVSSFYVVRGREGSSVGRDITREAAYRFLFAELLIQWANRKFELEKHGQCAMLHFSPHPPTRQQELNACISDSFYRELFMSPCLSGWAEGEAKRDYMHLCHQVLSRSQMNAVLKLREAGIIAWDLVSLPKTSNTSLANNGTHVSFGSRILTEGLSSNLLTDAVEKWLGDLTIKIAEHFLPLFVGTYSAAPYRFAFRDFHPERILGFLPHELDYTHLRFLWRTWCMKANIRILGQPTTPYGPAMLDRFVERTFRLRGDIVPDYRLIDYPVAWLSTDQSSALDGALENVERLKRDLQQLGIFDDKMSLYLPLRMRVASHAGYSGFEARHFSLFPTFFQDMAPAVDLQQLILGYAMYLVLSGQITHADLPDDPTSESERRQAFFAAALGLPVVYVRKDTPNTLLQRLIASAAGVRSSRRRSNYLHVPLESYRLALRQILCEQGPALIETLHAQSVMDDLTRRLTSKAEQASERLTQGVQGDASGGPLRTEAREFNLAAERYYRGDLKQEQISEALSELSSCLKDYLTNDMDTVAEMLRYGVRVQDPLRFIGEVSSRRIAAGLSDDELRALIMLLLVAIWAERRRNSHIAEPTINPYDYVSESTADAPVH